MIEGITVSGDYVLVNHNNVTYCLRAMNGRELWRQPESYLFSEGLMVAEGVAGVPAGNGMVGRSLRTGKVLWKSSNMGVSDGAQTLGRQFIGIGGGMLRGIDIRSGKVLWSRGLGPRDTSGGNQYLSVLGNRIFARGIERAGIYEGDGTPVSSGTAALAFPAPVWTDGKTVVCFDGIRLMSYRTGTTAALPRETPARQRLAADLTRRFGTLDATEIVRLKSLGDDAFEPVFTAFRTACATYDAVRNHGDSYPRYREFHDLADVLTAVTTSTRTKALVDGLTKTTRNGSAAPIILGLLAKVGDPAVVTPYFLEVLQGQKRGGFEPFESASYVARQYILSSRDPRAVAFLIRQLRDPTADAELRFGAYVHLAGSGDENALNAVLAARSRRAKLRPLEQRVIRGVLHAGEFGTKTDVLRERKDAMGNTWGLLRSGVLGNAGDLWLALKVNGNWSQPLFSGVSVSDRGGRFKAEPDEAKIGGKTGKALIAGDWLAVLSQSADLKRDTDGDGLTDLVEMRLGTDKSRVDTDGDGDQDGLDPWPNAAPRTLTDEEQIYAAVFEARFHFDVSEGPALLSAPGKMTPFEMPGRFGPVLWVAANETHPPIQLEKLWERGVAFIGFSPADRKQRGPEVIRWNRERTECTLAISVYFGGLNGTGYTARVRKFGTEWVVTSMEQAWVS